MEKSSTLLGIKSAIKLDNQRILVVSANVVFGLLSRLKGKKWVKELILQS